jgi:hypothetical protein
MDDDDRKIPKLGPNATDRIAAVSRAAASLVPLAGGALAEMVNEFIPNQRVDRIEKFISYLHEEIRLRAIPDEKLKTSESADFIVQGGDQAVRAPSEERIIYLARCVAEGISAEDQNKADERRLIALISDLDDRDFLILRSYDSRSQYDPSVAPRQVVVGSEENERISYQLYEAALERLERYGLLKLHITTDMDTRMPRFNRFSGKPEGYRMLSALGRRVLTRVGLLPPLEENIVPPRVDIFGSDGQHIDNESPFGVAES